MRPLILLFILFVVASSCAKKTSLRFDDPRADRLALEKQQNELESERLSFERARVTEWKDIVWSANHEFEQIKPMIETKCFACHDANTPLKFYGRIFRNHNPIAQHRENGLKNLDFSKGFPFGSQGNSPQLGILKAIKASVLDRTMPIKLYRVFYPARKINEDDEKAVLAWVDPLIEKIEAYEAKFSPNGHGPLAETKTLFEQKCIRCHGNGNARGGFTGMEDMPGLLKSKYVKLDAAEDSWLYKIMAAGKMPPDPRERVTPAELQSVRDWISAPKN